VNVPTYAGNYSPEIADLVAFAAPISMPLRQAIARRMLAYPTTLAGQPLLGLALQDLADGSPLRLAAYYALMPVGRLEAYVQESRDAYQTVQFIRQHPQFQTNSPPRPANLDWPALAQLATAATETQSGAGPFGFPADVLPSLARSQQYVAALGLYCSGRSNHDGRIANAADWESAMEHSAEWTDLRLEFQTLDELGAQPLAISLPFPGFYDDFTAISEAARNAYYQR
jgi:poly-D-alanine transfer protein DltD